MTSKENREKLVEESGTLGVRLSRVQMNGWVANQNTLCSALVA